MHLVADISVKELAEYYYSNPSNPSTHYHTYPLCSNDSKIFFKKWMNVIWYSHSV